MQGIHSIQVLEIKKNFDDSIVRNKIVIFFENKCTLFKNILKRIITLLKYLCVNTIVLQLLHIIQKKNNIILKGGET